MERDEIKKMLDKKYKIMKSLDDYDSIDMSKHEAWIKQQEERWKQNI